MGELQSGYRKGQKLIAGEGTRQSLAPHRLRQLGDVCRYPRRFVARETGPLGHKLGLASLMDGTVPPLPFQLPPLSSSRPKQPG